MIRASVQSLHPYTPGEQPRGADVVKLNTNENPYGPSPKVAAALRAADPERLRLYPDPVCGDLRARIAALHGCAPENVFIGNGSDEILALAIRAFVERDGTVGFFDPSYSLYPVLCAIEDVPTRPIALDADFAWREPPAPDASLFFVTNPNAPTSLLFDRTPLEAFCRRAAGVVLIDEAYVDFARASCVDLALALPNVLVTRSFSKSYGLAGLRVGYAIASAALIEALFKIKDSYNVSLLAQTLAAAAIDDQPWLRDAVARIVATRSRVTADLRARGWTVLDSETNFLFARPAGRAAKDIFESLRARRIFVRYFPGPRTGEFLRITIGTDSQMDILLAALG